MSYIPKFTIRRGYKLEEPLLRRTAKALSARFNTDQKWIEEFLSNNLCREKSLNELTDSRGKLKYEAVDSVLSDTDLQSQFLPSLIEMLSVLGASKTKAVIGLDTNSYDKVGVSKSGKAREKIYNRKLESSEKSAIETIRINRFLFDIFFNVIPPPVTKLDVQDESDEDEGDIDSSGDISHAELLRGFKSHLVSQKDTFIKGDGKSAKIFDQYPWYEKAFATGVPVTSIIYYKGMLAELNEETRHTKRFIYDENERVKYLKIEQPMIKVLSYESDSVAFRTSLFYRPSRIEKKDFEKTISSEDIRRQEILLREKIFKLRIESIQIIIEYLDGVPSKEPTDAISELMSNLFSRDEAQAIIGKNPKYFGLPDGTEYKHRDEFVFHRILRTATFLPATENASVKRLIRDSKPIFDYSLDVEGPHSLSFTYIELLYLLKAAEVERIIPTLAFTVERFSSMEKRAFDTFLRTLRLDKNVQDEGTLTTELNSYAKQIADRTDIVIPYLKEILAPKINEPSRKKTGIFTEDFMEFHPVNKKIGIIKFTAQQAKVMSALTEALVTTPSGEIKRLTLVDKVYSVDIAEEIRLKHGKKVEKSDGTESAYKYEWRLEKTLIKENHPAWDLGLVALGDKIGGDKSYKLNLDFESNIDQLKKTRLIKKRKRKKL